LDTAPYSSASPIHTTVQCDCEEWEHRQTRRIFFTNVSELAKLEGAIEATLTAPKTANSQALGTARRGVRKGKYFEAAFLLGLFTFAVYMTASILICVSWPRSKADGFIATLATLDTTLLGSTMVWDTLFIWSLEAG
jgi:hypothetical protein